MNWVDYMVLAIIGGYTFLGYIKGCIYSVFKVASFFIATFMSMKFYPVVSNILISATNIDKKINEMVANNVGKAIEQSGQVEQGMNTEAVGDVVSSLGLPQSMQTMITDNLSVQTNQVAGNIVGGISQSLSSIAVNIISMILIFVVVSCILIFVRTVLDGIAKLPILKQINKAGGIVFGCIQGIAIIYIIFAIVTLFASVQEVQPVFTSINNSLIAKYFYTYNLLIIWAFGYK